MTTVQDVISAIVAVLGPIANEYDVNGLAEAVSRRWPVTGADPIMRFTDIEPGDFYSMAAAFDLYADPVDACPADFDYDYA